MTISVILGAALALGPSAADNRAAIQKAVDETSAAGGGRVTIPVGAWTTGSIRLKDGVELHLPKGATLKGSADRKDYNANEAFPDNVWSVAEEWSGGHLVWAWCAENVAVTGEGVIDGNGPAFFGECDEDSRFPHYKYGLRLHPTDRDWFRPGMMLAFFRCRNVRLTDVTLARTTAWTCHLRCCDGVDIRGVTIDADRTIANSDGFSIDCTRNVRVEKCVIRTGDDGFAIRASCPEHATTNFCENIEIRDCDIWSCCYALRFGIGSGTIRNVRVSDTRIHEGTDGFGFTPAWIAGARNCYIEDIAVRNCTVSQCVSAAAGGPAGADSKVVGISFEDCTFETLLPVEVEGGPRCEMSFVNCERRPIDRFAVRHRRFWRADEIRNKRLAFARVSGDRSRIRIENCRPQPFGSAGVLLLTFDDRHFDDWEKAIPLFAKYSAHATFFVCGEFTPDAVRTAKRLMAQGHSIGLHGQRHADAAPTIGQKGAGDYYGAEIATVRRQADVAYVPVRNFAYPGDWHDAASDTFLLSRFDRVLTTDGRAPFPVDELPSRRLLDRVQVGEAYNTDIDAVVASVRRAGERKETLVLASHGIRPNATHVHMKTEWLERILAAAREAGVMVLGLDELPLKR